MSQLETYLNQKYCRIFYPTLKCEVDKEINKNKQIPINDIGPIIERDSPEVRVLRLKEEFLVRFVQDLFEVRQGDALRGYVDPDQVGGLLVLQMVDDPGTVRHAVPHGSRLGSDLGRRADAGPPCELRVSLVGLSLVRVAVQMCGSSCCRYQMMLSLHLVTSRRPQ